MNLAAKGFTKYVKTGSGTYRRPLVPDRSKSNAESRTGFRLWRPRRDLPIIFTRRGSRRARVAAGDAASQFQARRSLNGRANRSTAKRS